MNRPEPFAIVPKKKKIKEETKGVTLTDKQLKSMLSERNAGKSKSSSNYLGSKSPPRKQVNSSSSISRRKKGNAIEEESASRASNASSYEIKKDTTLKLRYTGDKKKLKNMGETPSSNLTTE